MADVTISSLPLGTPTTGIIVPWSDGTTTYQAKLSSLITAQGNMGTGAIQLPSGTAVQRPVPVEGQIRYNSTLKTIEFYNGTRWVIVSTTLFSEVLIVGGGGSGGNWYYAGGGGAGGVVSTTVNIAAGTYSVIVGKGGVQTSNANLRRGINGENSSFLGLIAYGGGGGGSGASGGPGSLNGAAGGCGGGGCVYDAGITGGAGTPGQGFAGGNGAGYPSANGAGGAGGGGGAGGVGINGNQAASKSGDGGPGISSLITGEAKFYAGGGGGAAGISSIATPGTGGSGVGGNGALYNNNLGAFNNGNAVQNTGSGGGGSHYTENNYLPGSGANGVVIIAYPGTQAVATGGTISTTSRPGYVVHTFTNPGDTFSF